MAPVTDTAEVDAEGNWVKKQNVNYAGGSVWKSLLHPPLVPDDMTFPSVKFVVLKRRQRPRQIRHPCLRE